MPEAPKARLYGLLRRSERYFKTDMVYLASGGFWSLVGQFAASLTSLALAVAVSHLLTKDVYGTYKYILSIVAILGTLSLSGLSTAVFQSAARGYEGALHEGFWVNLRWSVLIFVGAFVAAAYYYVAGNSTLAVGILLGGCLSPFLTSGNLSASYLAAKKDFKRLAIYFDVIENLIPVALLIATIALTQNPAIIAAVYFAANTLVTLWLYRKVVRTYRPDRSKLDAGTLAYSKHLSVMGIISGLAGNIDQVLLFHFVGPVQLAIYAFATAIPDQMKGPLKSLDQMMQARFVNHSNSNIQATMGVKMFWMFIFGLGATIAYFFVAPLIYMFFFPAYINAIPYSQVYMLYMLAVFLGPAGSFLTAKKKVREQYINTVVSSVVQIAAVAIGIIGWGLWGLIITRVVLRIGGSIFSYALYRTSVAEV